MRNAVKIALCATIIVAVTAYAAWGGDREDRIETIKARLAPALDLSFEELQLALSIKVHQTFDGASVLANDDDETYLGKIDNPVVGESIFSKVGQYGSKFASKSIWNEFGRFGGEIARYSPFNEISSSSPYIVKDGKVIGRLTVNDSVRGAVDPNWLKTFYK